MGFVNKTRINSNNTKKKSRQYLKGRELDEDQLVSSKAKLCFPSFGKTWFPVLSLKVIVQTVSDRSNDKTIIELGFRKIS